MSRWRHLALARSRRTSSRRWRPHRPASSIALVSTLGWAGCDHGLSWAAKLVRIATALAGSLALAAWAILAIVHADDRYLVNHVSGAWMALAQYANDGLLYPPLYDGESFGGTRQMPLQILAHAGLARVSGEYLVSGKSLGVRRHAGARRDCCPDPALALRRPLVADDRCRRRPLSSSGTSGFTAPSRFEAMRCRSFCSWSRSLPVRCLTLTPAPGSGGGAGVRGRGAYEDDRALGRRWQSRLWRVDRNRRLTGVFLATWLGALIVGLAVTEVATDGRSSLRAAWAPGVPRFRVSARRCPTRRKSYSRRSLAARRSCCSRSRLPRGSSRFGVERLTPTTMPGYCCSRSRSSSSPTSEPGRDTRSTSRSSPLWWPRTPGSATARMAQAQRSSGSLFRSGSSGELCSSFSAGACGTTHATRRGSPSSCPGGLRRSRSRNRAARGPGALGGSVGARSTGTAPRRARPVHAASHRARPSAVGGGARRSHRQPRLHPGDPLRSRRRPNRRRQRSDLAHDPLQQTDHRRNREEVTAPNASWGPT